MGLIVFGHPRSRTNLLCSYIDGFPKEIFHLAKVNSQAELDWSLNENPQTNKNTGVAERYLNKVKSSPPKAFKLFGLHLEEWPEVLDYVKSLNYDVIRVYRKNKLNAILSLLIGVQRGFTSFSQKNVSEFTVPFKHFEKAYDAIVTYDEKWKNSFTYSEEIEYDELPALIKSGKLSRYGVNATQLYPLENQNSIDASKKLILNIDEVTNWFYKKSTDKS